MNIVFYTSASIAILSTIMVITRYKPVHALLYLIISFFAAALVFFSLGAPFVAVLEVIIYAGAILVLFIFVIMLLNLGQETAAQEKEWLKPKLWIGPVLLSLILFVELIYLLIHTGSGNYTVQVVDPKQVALSLYGPYLIGVEIAALLLMAGIVGAAHIGQHKKRVIHRFLD